MHTYICTSGKYYYITGYMYMYLENITDIGSVFSFFKTLGTQLSKDPLLLLVEKKCICSDIRHVPAIYIYGNNNNGAFKYH